MVVLKNDDPDFCIWTEIHMGSHSRISSGMAPHGFEGNFVPAQALFLISVQLKFNHLLQCGFLQYHGILIATSIDDGHQESRQLAHAGPE